MISPPQIQRFGTSSILLTWDQPISEKLLEHIINSKNIIVDLYENEILEIVNTYNTLAIYLKGEVELNKLLNELHEVNFNQATKKDNESIWTIPVCFDAEFGLDLNSILKLKNLDKSTFIELFTKRYNLVYFIGFLPGFPYLGGLDSKLSSPRKSSPRLNVSKGSVAIANDQIGIYPQDSPGGWQIVGRTPLDIFDISNDIPSPFQSGDRIKFYEIDSSSFKELVDAPLNWDDYKNSATCCNY